MVEKILGVAQKTEKVKVNQAIAGLKACYCQGAVEICYIENVADWIILYNIDNKAVAEFVNYFGLDSFLPAIYNGGTVQYRDIAGFQEITYTIMGGIPLSIKIKVFTK